MFDDGVTSVSFRYTSTWLKREWSQLFTGATGVSTPMLVPFRFTIFARTSRYVLARSRYASPVPGRMNSIGPPESRDVNGWCSIQPHSSILVCVGGTANKSSSLFTLSHDCRCTKAILGEYVRSLSLGGTGPTTGCNSFYTFRRRCSSFYTFAWRWGCGEKTAHQGSSGCCSSLFCCLLDILTSHNVAGYLRTGC